MTGLAKERYATAVAAHNIAVEQARVAGQDPPPPPARIVPPVKKATRKVTDALVKMEGTFKELCDILDRQIARWVPHAYVEHHQLKARNRSIQNVKNAPPGTRAAILIDWSSTLQLAPNYDASCGAYEKCGIMIAIVVYKCPERGFVCWSYPVFCETEDADVR